MKGKAASINKTQQIQNRIAFLVSRSACWLSVVICFLLLFPISGKTKETAHLYSTGTVMEIDRCASAWLIKRYVDKEAIFKFFPDGSLITEGIAFDTPDAKLQRTHNMSTFESILAEYEINDPRLQKITMAIHDLEINLWGNMTRPESREMEADIKNLVKNTSNNDESLSACFHYFDEIVTKQSKEH